MPENRKKPAQRPFELRIPTGDCILFPFSGAEVKFFRAKTRPGNAVGMLGAEGGALFRLRGAQPKELILSSINSFTK